MPNPRSAAPLPETCRTNRFGASRASSLALALDNLLGFRLPYLPTSLAMVGVLGLLGASLYLGREVSLSVRGFDRELDQELARRRR